MFHATNVPNMDGFPLTELQSLWSLQPVDKPAMVMTNEGAEEAP